MMMMGLSWSSFVMRKTQLNLLLLRIIEMMNEKSGRWMDQTVGAAEIDDNEDHIFCFNGTGRAGLTPLSDIHSLSEKQTTTENAPEKKLHLFILIDF